MKNHTFDEEVCYAPLTRCTPLLLISRDSTVIKRLRLIKIIAYTSFLSDYNTLIGFALVKITRNEEEETRTNVVEVKIKVAFSYMSNYLLKEA